MDPDEFETFKNKYSDDFAHHADDILPTVNAWRDWPWGKQPNFWATDAGKCDRRLWLTMWDVKKSNSDLSDDTTNTFAIGNKVEEHVVDKYRHLRGRMWTQAGGAYSLITKNVTPFTVMVNHAIEKYGSRALDLFIPKVTYKMDIVFDDIDKQFSAEVCRYIVEVKSIKDWPFKSHTRTGEKLPYFIGCDDAPSEDYYLQICQYLYYEQVADGMLHFVNKNTGAEKVWHVDLEAATHAVETVVLPKFRNLWEMYVLKRMPDRNHLVALSKDGSRILKTGSDWECQYCPFADRCWGVGDYEPLEKVEQLKEWLENVRKEEEPERSADEEGKVQEGGTRLRRRKGKKAEVMVQ